eukprot:scaffold90814_cov63-Phaeocystis_antarctica.AAC.2
MGFGGVRYWVLISGLVLAFRPGLGTDSCQLSNTCGGASRGRIAYNKLRLKNGGTKRVELAHVSAFASLYEARSSRAQDTNIVCEGRCGRGWHALSTRRRSPILPPV